MISTRQLRSGYRHDGCHALVLPLQAAPVRPVPHGHQEYHDAKPVAIHILRKPAVGDLKRPFKAAGMFGAGAFRPRHRLLFFLPYSPLCRISCRTKNRRCCDRRSGEEDWKVITSWKESASADSYLSLHAARTIVGRKKHTGTQFFVEMLRRQSLVFVRNFKLFVVSEVFMNLVGRIILGSIKN